MRASVPVMFQVRNIPPTRRPTGSSDAGCHGTEKRAAYRLSGAFSSGQAGNADPPSAAEHLLQIFQFVAQARIGIEFLVDLADRVQDSCMITVAETPADLRQRPGGELL